MNDITNWKVANKGVENSIPVAYDFGEVEKELYENALHDAKSQLHPLLRNVTYACLEQRGEFVLTFKSALEHRIARKLAAWQPDVQAVFRFDETRITNAESWDGSIHLLVKVPRLSNAIKSLGRRLDHSLVSYLVQLHWKRFRTRRSILEVQQVTLSELRHAVSYGAMFCAVYTVPVQVWPQS
jgi:hypothetical protein